MAKAPVRCAAGWVLFAIAFARAERWSAATIGLAIAGVIVSVVLVRSASTGVREAGARLPTAWLIAFALAWAARPAPASARFAFVLAALVFASVLVAVLPERQASRVTRASATRAWAARLALAALVFAVALAAAEVWAQQRWPRNPHGIAADPDSDVREPYLPDTELGLVFAPGFRGRFTHPEYSDEAIATNADGFRDVDWPNPMPEDEVRVLVLGDSTAVGFGVERDHTIPAGMEAQLEKALAPRAVRVLNAGVPSYGARHERILLERLWDRARPDVLVVVFYDGNDLSDARDQVALERVRDGARPDQRELEQLAAAPSLFDVAYWRRYSMLMRRATFLTGGWIGGGELAPEHAYGNKMLEAMRREPAPLVREEIEWTVEALLAIERTARERSSPVVIARLPARVQVERAAFERLVEEVGADQPGRYDRTLPGRTVLERCAAAGARTLDLLPILEGADSGPHYFREGHPNVSGNDVAALEIAHAVESALAPR